MDKHDCSLDGPSGLHGSAVDDCYENDAGEFWVGNGEYASQVNFCPVCGAKAPKQIEKKDKP
jgi:hypothetical protein